MVGRLEGGSFVSELAEKKSQEHGQNKLCTEQTGLERLKQKLLGDSTRSTSLLRPVEMIQVFARSVAIPTPIVS